MLAAVLFFASKSLAAGIEYKADVEGAGRSVTKQIEESSQTFRLKKRPPATEGQLRRRVEKDLPRIGAVLESNGYYDAEVVPELDTAKEPVRIRFRITPGEQYRLRNLHLSFGDNADPALKEIALRLSSGNPVIASEVVEEQQRILAELRQFGYPFPVLLRREVEVNCAHQRVDLRMTFDPGIAAVYGSLEVEGLKTLKQKYIQRQLIWKKGERYDARQLSEFENRLLGTGLFGTARVEPLPPAEETNAIPIKITVSERDLRTIRLGAGYSDVGPNGKIFWEHRNLFGGGEHLESQLTYSPIEFGGKVSITRPGFLRSNQSLILDADVVRETPDAYDTDKVQTGLAVQRDVTRHLMLGTGIRYKYSHVEQLNVVDEYSHVIFPLYGTLDYRDDKLNPVSGAHLLGRVRYYEDLNGSASFFKTEAEARLYALLWKRPGLSLAGRVMAGSLDGTSVGNIPADERFYAGGGGSIRGYEYQMVGPVQNGIPVGGSQVFEFSAEVRLNPGKKLGYAVFIDGGTAYNDLENDADRSLRYGAGIGLRFFTGIGPLRADVAYPLNPSDQMVERVQFYISLGQAF